MRTVLRCPVCRKPLTKKEYDKALGIMKENERYHAAQRDKYLRQIKEEKNKTKKAREEGVLAERARNQRLLKGKEAEIQRLKERIKHIQKGSTPQTGGLEFEEKLVERLRREYPEDKIEHKGKGGDVLHQVFFHGKNAGVIVYECKRTPRISKSHISQTLRARRERNADFCVLVTTGTRSRFSGFDREGEVLIVSPLGVIALVEMLRCNLIEMLQARVERRKRAEVAARVLAFVSDKQFKQRLGDIIATARNLNKELEGEMKDHIRHWKHRSERYNCVGLDAQNIRENIELVIQGKEPKSIVEYPKNQVLQIPSKTG